MKRKPETEYANEKINDFFNEDRNHDKLDVDPLIDNNTISLNIHPPFFGGFFML